MAVSTLPDFREVELGPHEEKIRRMLIAGDPGSAEDYGCMLQIALSPQTLSAKSGVFDRIVFVEKAARDSHKIFGIELHTKSEAHTDDLPNDLIFEVWNDTQFVCSGGELSL